MEFTGERMVPEACGEDTFWEHVYRYRFALRYVQGRRTLDIACGEGYGTSAMQRYGASSVVGVDLSEEACAHATARYGVTTIPGDALSIPLKDASVDAVVSFETIEHVARPAAFLDECLRVLSPGGVFIVSTPNREQYRELNSANEFHCSELSVGEFVDLIESRFCQVQYYCQRPRAVPFWDSRGLAAEYWPGRRIRGVGRLRSLLLRWTCAHLSSSATAVWRRDPVRAVRLQLPRLATLVDPYAIRPCNPEQADMAIYTIAVATR